MLEAPVYSNQLIKLHNKATEVAAAFRGFSASDPAVRLALAAGTAAVDILLRINSTIQLRRLIVTIFNCAVNSNFSTRREKRARSIVYVPKRERMGRRSEACTGAIAREERGFGLGGGPFSGTDFQQRAAEDANHVI